MSLIGVCYFQTKITFEVATQFILAVLNDHIADRELPINWNENSLQPILQ